MFLCSGCSAWLISNLIHTNCVWVCLYSADVLLCVRCCSLLMLYTWCILYIEIFSLLYIIPRNMVMASPYVSVVTYISCSEWECIGMYLCMPPPNLPSCCSLMNFYTIKPSRGTHRTKFAERCNKQCKNIWWNFFATGEHLFCFKKGTVGNMIWRLE